LAPGGGGLLGPDPLLGLLLAAGRKVTCRALSWERVQRDRSGQGRQSGCRKVARMIGRPSRLRAGCQLRLVLPRGQTTWWASSSILKRVRSNAVSSPACQLVSGGSGPVSWQAMVVGRSKDLPDADIARVDQVDIGQ
jgi:hypothetical protein